MVGRHHLTPAACYFSFYSYMYAVQFHKIFDFLLDNFGLSFPSIVRCFIFSFFRFDYLFVVYFLYSSITMQLGVLSVRERATQTHTHTYPGREGMRNDRRVHKTSSMPSTAHTIFICVFNIYPSHYGCLCTLICETCMGSVDAEAAATSSFK